MKHISRFLFVLLLLAHGHVFHPMPNNMLPSKHLQPIEFHNNNSADIKEIMEPKSKKMKGDSTVIHLYRMENIGKLIQRESLPLANSHADYFDSISNKGITDIKAMKASFTSMNKYLLIDFENDIFTNTDFYYTNGTQISLIHPGLQHFFLLNRLPDAGKGSINHYGIGLRQNMYTPVDPEGEFINYNDRPFSGIMMIELFKISTCHQRHLRLTATIQLGAIGAISLASTFQNAAHELKPNGWKFQIKDDVLLNINVAIEKNILKTRNVEINIEGKAFLGTYQTKAATGLKFRAGILPLTFNPFATSKLFTIEHVQSEKHIPVWFFVDIHGNRIFYDASLNGGFFNKESPFVISGNNTMKYTLQLAMGVAASYKRTSITLKLIYLSPEFKQGVEHRWGALTLNYNL
ncbi:MAG: hypothetical protein CVT92_14875 [Bacteroidetes bacterium HGW-Bacteroidetes-1]|jgi:hypothetical protein|nr:MAG: hypothetical protein CVT92_14875 [Bacteroidetes bacterium HGW-Bacteroidetes-1]